LNLNRKTFYLAKIKEVSNFLVNIKFSKIKKNENILIYGISRGGTTLLAEILVSVLKARLVWEPLFPYGDVKFHKINPFSVEPYAKFKLGWHPYVASQDDKQVHNYFDKYFALKIRNIRFLRFTNQNSFSESQHTIHKFCFGNFMYPYFQKRYGFKSMLLLRHPFAIAASSLGFGDNFNWHKENYTNWNYPDTPKSDDFFKSYDDNYSLIVSGFSLLVFQAVTQFSYALNNLDHENTSIVFYEDLVVEPKEAYSSIQKLVGLHIDYDLFLKMLDKQSFSSKKDHTEKEGLAQLSKWKKVATKQDIKDGIKIFEAFNFRLYSEDVLPLKTNINNV
jgi:hypothetical protein